MRVIRREWFNVKRADVYKIIPLGDVHDGNVACNLSKFKSVVDYIKEEPSTYWIGLGDYADFINRKDPRFHPDSLADWIKVKHLGDLAGAQAEHFLDIINPIAGKCLALIEGNHERAIKKHYERDIYSEIVTGVKQAGDFEPDVRLALGMCGWLILNFYRSKKRERGANITINLHHGFVGGRLAGAKALNMQRWLWNHDADLIIFGHSHNTAVQAEAVESVDKGGNVQHARRIGCYAGTFLESVTDGVTTYSEERGYFPLPTGHIEVVLRPGARDPVDRIKIMS